MGRASFCLLLALVGVGLASAQGQRPIQWIGNVQQGINRARAAGLPVLFYVSGSRRGDDSDLEDAQQRTFSHPLVRGLVQARFLPVRLARSTETTKLLQRIFASRAADARAGGGGPTAAPRFGRFLLCATPELELIGVILPGQATDAQAFARQLTGMFRKYRAGVLERQLKPLLESEEARPRELLGALRTIQRLLILEADQSVARLLERDRLNTTVRKEAYDTLAVLSTRASAKALLEAAAHDKRAAQALRRCTPGVVEELLAALDLSKPDRFMLAYQAVAEICKIRRTRPLGFWTGKNPELISRELEQFEREARRVAKRWKDRYEAYR